MSYPNFQVLVTRPITNKGEQYGLNRIWTQDLHEISYWRNGHIHNHKWTRISNYLIGSNASSYHILVPLAINKPILIAKGNLVMGVFEDIFKVSNTLLPISKLVLNLMLKRNASKFGIFSPICIFTT